MSRDEGFAVADMDTGKHDDPKFKRLWRNLKDEATMNAAVALYESVQLESWSQGERVLAEDATPFWMTEPEPLVAALRKVGLLDDETRIPTHAWETWFGAAYERREKRRRNGEQGGRPPKNRPDNNGKPDGLQPETGRITVDNPVRPSVRPSDPTVPSVAPAKESGSKDLEPSEELLRRLALEAEQSPLTRRRH
jgi:hypothetical protein